jgi:SAM-dependent methyltransferase
MSAAGRRGWRDFWKHDCLSACMPDNSATAEQIADVWRQQFSVFPDGARILDVATGNGIVLAHAARAARTTGRRFELTGIDLADIDPPRYVSELDPDLKSARFLGGVAAESLPFTDSSFDVVASQYGVEYADLELALTEVARVLAPGGSLIWLAHGESSAVVRQHRDQVLEVDFLLAPDGPVRVMRTFAERIERRQDMNESLGLLSESFDRAKAFCRAHPPASVVREVCDEFLQAARRWQAYGPQGLAQLTETAERRLDAHRDRIQSLLAAVMTPRRIERARGRLEAAPWQSLDLAELCVGARQSPIGLLIEARLAADGPDA